MQPSFINLSPFPPSRRGVVLGVAVLIAALVAVVALRPDPTPARRRVLLVSPGTTSPGITTSSTTSTSTTSTSTSTVSTTSTTTSPSTSPTSTGVTAIAPGAAAPPGAPEPLVYYPGGPNDLTPLAAGSYSGEGHWVPAGRFVAGRPAVWVTTLRPPSGGNPVGIAQMDTSRLSVVPFAGTTQPGGTWSNQGEISADRQPGLVAAFNGGFQFNSAEGGFFADGHAQPPLRDGAASLVEFLDGSAVVGQWGRDVSMGPYVIAVRQNLKLLVDAGAVVSSASDWGQWGATLSHTAATWRSGIGSDDQSHLYFVGGPGLTPADLGAVLVAGGAKRAMEFDINPQWVIFASYTDGAGSPPSTFGAKLLPAMYYSADHFFSPDWRDFVAVFAREPASAKKPPSTK